MKSWQKGTYPARLSLGIKGAMVPQKHKLRVPTTQPALPEMLKGFIRSKERP